MNIDPLFVTKSDLHILEPKLHHAGTPVNIKDDIDGDIRNSSTPDIGADETAALNDAGISAILDPTDTNCTGAARVKIQFKNYGLNSLASLQINALINGNLYGPFLKKPTLSYKSSDTFSFGISVLAAGKNTIKVWTSSPNATSDDNNFNDTVSVAKYVLLIPLPFVNKDTTLCNNIFFALPNSLAGNKRYNFSWSSSITGFSSTSSQPVIRVLAAKYYLKSSDGSCNRIDTFEVKPFLPKAAGISGDTLLCNGTTATYFANPHPKSQYNWSASGGAILSGTKNDSCTVTWKSHSAYIQLIEKDSNTCLDTSYLNVYPHTYPNLGWKINHIPPYKINAIGLDSQVWRYAWKFGDSSLSIIGKWNVWHTYKDSGSYKLTYEVTDSFGCLFSKDSLVQFHFTHIADRMNILAGYGWPNPVFDQFNWQFKPGQQSQVVGGIISVFDIHGKRLRLEEVASQDGLFNIDLKGLPSGIYFFELRTDENEVYNCKLNKL